METTSEPAWLAALLGLGPSLLWVGAVLLICVMFRDKMSALIERIQKVKAPGVDVDLSAEEQATLSSSSASVAPALSQVPGQPIETLPGLVPTSAVVATSQELFQQPLGQEPSARLARYWFVSFYTERIYRLIFGQQIRLVQLANAGLATYGAVMDCFNESRRLGNRQTFTQFIEFLTKSALIETKDNGQTYQVTVTGKMLLAFINMEGYPTDKAW